MTYRHHPTDVPGAFYRPHAGPVTWPRWLRPSPAATGSSWCSGHERSGRRITHASPRDRDSTAPGGIPPTQVITIAPCSTRRTAAHTGAVAGDSSRQPAAEHLSSPTDGTDPPPGSLPVRHGARFNRPRSAHALDLRLTQAAVHGHPVPALDTGITALVTPRGKGIHHLLPATPTTQTIHGTNPPP